MYSRNLPGRLPEPASPMPTNGNRPGVRLSWIATALRFRPVTPKIFGHTAPPFNPTAESAMENSNGVYFRARTSAISALLLIDITPLAAT